MGNFISPVIEIIRRFWLYFLIVLAGVNAWVWYKQSDKVSYYEINFKARVKNQFYNHTRNIFSRLSDENTWKAGNELDIDKQLLEKIIRLGVRSYRNEDIYIVELNIHLNDTKEYNAIIHSIAKYMEKDSYLREHYYDRMESFNKIFLLSEQVKVNIKQTLNTSGTFSQDTEKLLDLYIKIQEAAHYREVFRKEFEIIVPSGRDLRLIVPQKMRLHVIASVLAVMILFVIAAGISGSKPSSGA